ncbi:L-2-hydroxyglutarate oxidase [Roseomonas sp. BN140053]|uniref:L-2-hydroxyglutarate oxidase n=1 Tax=Roseomonas sp. BN140053 TaxID=3391898 RepID=UPI0039E94372
MIHDYCVVGGGIVGLATAMVLLRRQPGASLVLLEKEARLGQHQTGHNSGVIHAGIYYAPGSLKAELCRRGAAATKEFCTEHNIPFETCGKLIVATNAAELARMDALFERSIRNAVPVERIDAAELRRREPNVAGVGALWSPSTGIVDYARVCDAMGEVIRAAGGEVVLGAAVTAIREGVAEVTVSAGERRWSARRLVVCGGLQSDRLATLAGLRIEHRIVPFRGEYYRLPPSRNDVVRSLIYPVPDPELPFLGVHLTRMIDGGVTVGPNAVLGFAREGYRKGSISARDVVDYARFGGFWRTVLRHRRSAMGELRDSFWKPGYLAQCRKYCPSLTLADLLPQEAGIRAQAVLRDGTLVQDFLFGETDRMLHVFNAPSPAATSAIPIGEMIADKCGRVGN